MILWFTRRNTFFLVSQVNNYNSTICGIFTWSDGQTKELSLEILNFQPKKKSEK